MRAVVYRLRIALRSERRGFALSAALVGAVVATVLGMAAAAHRTSTAPDRYTRRYGRGFDVTATQDGGAPRTDDVVRLPAVREAASATFLFGGLTRAGDPPSARIDTLTFFGEPDGTGAHLVAGRAPSRGRPGEFVGNRTFVSSTGARLGDRFDLRTLSAAQASRYGYQLPPGIDPGGPERAARMVGVVESPGELDDPSAMVIFSPSLESGYLGKPAARRMAVSGTVIAVDLARGATVAQLRRQLASLPPRADPEDPLAPRGGSVTFKLQTDSFVTGTTRDAVAAQATGLWAITAVAALAGLVLAGQLVARRSRLSDDERGRLRALGARRREQRAEVLGRAAVPVVVGAVAGGVLALVPSGAFPTGMARQLEPDPGFHADLLVLGLGALALAAALEAWTMVVLLVEGRGTNAVRPSPLAGVVADRVAAAPVATGVRFAYTRTGQDASSARSSAVGLLITLALLVGALTFGAGIGRLVDEPWRYGQVGDVMLGQGEDDIEPQLLRRLARDPAVGAITYFAQGTARAGGSELGVLGIRPVRGRLGPALVDGRLPETADEVAIGPLSSDELHAPIGARLTMRSERGDRRYRVTGLVVLPAVSSNDGAGRDALLTYQGFTRLFDPNQFPAAVARLRPGVPHSRAFGVYHRIYPDARPTDMATTPPSITNVSRTRSTPTLLAVVLGGLAVIAVGYAAATARRRRGRDLAILAALGAGPRWLAQVSQGQVLAVVVPTLVGVPVGILLGARVFQAFARHLGVVDDPALPVLASVVVAVTTLGIASLVTVALGRRGRTARRDGSLRAE